MKKQTTREMTQNEVAHMSQKKSNLATHIYIQEYEDGIFACREETMRRDLEQKVTGFGIDAKWNVTREQLYHEVESLTAQAWECKRDITFSITFAEGSQS